VSIPIAWRGRFTLAQERKMLGDDARDAAALGARIVRANSPVYPYLSHHALKRSSRGESFDWTRPDAWVSEVQAAGLDALVVLGPWPGNQTAAYTDAYVPADLDAYAAYVTAVVERYDRDGQGDMPGLVRPIRHWEVDNEPDLHNSVPPKGGDRGIDPETFQTPAQYAQVLRVTSAAIRAADPAAVILSAGLFRGDKAAGREYLAAVLAEPGAREAFDVVSLHAYFSDDALDAPDAALENARALAPDKPVWITETSVPSSGERHHSPEWQARMVAGVYGAFLAGGAQRIFWHTLADPPQASRHASRSGFSTNSLMSTQGAPQGPGARGPGAQVRRPQGDLPRIDKPAGEVYRRLTALLADAELSRLREVPADGGRLLWTGDGWLAFEGHPRVPEGAAMALDLLTGVESAAGRRVIAPTWIAPQGGYTPASTGVQPTDSLSPPDG